MTPIGLIAVVAGELVLSAPPGGCPTADQVRTELRALSVSPPARADTFVTIEAPGSDVLRIVLSRGGGVTTRSLRVSPDCDRRARTAAVVIASFELRVEEIAVPALPPPLESVAPTVEGELGAGAFVSTDGAGAIGAELEGALVASRWASPQARLGISTPQTTALATGRARWTRGFGALGVRQSFGSAWRLVLREEALIVVTHAEGSGYDDDHGATRVVPALGVAARAGRSFERWTLWLELGGFVAAKTQRVVAEAPDRAQVAVSLPRATASVVVGVSRVMP